MNKLHKFAKLSPEEQKFVIDLCDQHGYDKAQELLAEDRPVGLNFNTSRASLCRYYSRYHPDAAQYIRSAEHANALQIRHQAADGALTEGTLALVQSRIFESLQKGRPLADMAAEFRIFNQVHRAFLAEDAWRRKNGIKTKDKYYDYIKTLIGIPQCDFGRNDIEEDPGSEGVDPVEFDIYETDEELDVFVAEVEEGKARARDCAAKQAQARSAADPGSVGPGVIPILEVLAKAQKEAVAKTAQPSSNPTVVADHPDQTNQSHESDSRPEVRNSTSTNAKTPVIPTFSSNPTSNFSPSHEQARHIKQTRQNGTSG